LRGFVLAALLLAGASAALADGGRLRATEDAGDFRVAIFTSPEPLTAGPADVSVLVQDRWTGEAILDAEVILELSGPGGSAISKPAGRHGRNRLLYGAKVDLAAGPWTVAARVRRVNADAVARAAFDVGDAETRTFDPWPYLAIPPLAAGVFAVNRRLRRRARAGALTLLVLWGSAGCFDHSDSSQRLSGLLDAVSSEAK
jgi:hypothetical protein